MGLFDLDEMELAAMKRRDRLDSVRSALVPPREPRLDLFQTGRFTLNSGVQRDWKIECDSLTDGDIATLARMIAPRLPAFKETIPVPRGGCRLAAALNEYATEGYGYRLIVEDVLTTGASMEAVRAALPGGNKALGLVIFACKRPPRWVIPIWTMWNPDDRIRLVASDGAAEYADAHYSGYDSCGA